MLVIIMIVREHSLLLQLMKEFWLIQINQFNKSKIYRKILHNIKDRNNKIQN